MSFVPPSSAARSPQPPTFREARDLLLHLRDDYHGARAAFSWPKPERFNWALDWFDAELAAGEHGAKTALKVIGERVETRTFAELSQEFRAPRERSSRAWREARRSALDDARRRPRAVGDDAGFNEARPRHDPGDAAAGRSRHRRPAHARQGQISRRPWARRREIRGACRCRRAHRGRRDAPRLAELRRALKRRRALRARRLNPSRRPDAHLFHLGHDGALEARRPYPFELPDRTSHDDVWAGPEARRRPSQHFLARLGQARLVERLCALECGSLHRRARRAL